MAEKRKVWCVRYIHSSAKHHANDTQYTHRCHHHRHHHSSPQVGDPIAFGSRELWQHTYDRSQSSVVLETRLDADDAVHVHFVSRLRSFALDQQQRPWLPTDPDRASRWPRAPDALCRASRLSDRERVSSRCRGSRSADPEKEVRGGCDPCWASKTDAAEG